MHGAQIDPGAVLDPAGAAVRHGAAARRSGAEPVVPTSGGVPTGASGTAVSVRGAAATGSGTQEGGPVRFVEPGLVGRHAELGRLRGCVTDAGMGRGAVVGLCGRPGAGKSRVLDVVAAGATAAGVTVLRGTPADHGARRPLGLFGSALTELADLLVARPDVVADVGARPGGLAAPVVALVPEMARVLGDRAELSSPATEVSGALTAIARMLVAVFTATRPGLLILDDCETADELSWQLLAVIARTVCAGAGHLTVVFAFRPEAQAAVRSWELPEIVQVELGPLGPGEVRALVVAAAGQIPDEVGDYIAGHSLGVPLYVLSTLRALIDSGVLVAVGGRWTVDEARLRGLPPASAGPEHDLRSEAFVAARMAQLDPITRTVLEQAAVLGQRVQVAVLASALGWGTGDVERVLDDAADRGFLHRAAGGPAVVEVVHDGFRDAVLSSLDEPGRRAAHRRAARALIVQETSDDHAIAHHLHRGGASTLALPHALRAGEAALRRHALDVAETFLTIARTGIDAADGVSGRDRFRVHEGIGTLHMLQGGYDTAAEHLDAAYGAALGLDPVDCGRVAIARGELAFKKGTLGDADLWTSRAVAALGLRHPTSAAAAAGWSVVELARWVTLLVVQIVRPAPVSDRAALAARLYNRLSYQSWFTSTPAWNVWSMLRALRFAQAAGSVRQLSQAYSGSAACLAGLAPVLAPVALRLVGRSLRLRRALGDEWGVAQSRHFRGFVLYAASRFDEASAEFDAAVRAFAVLGDRWEQIAATWQQALCLYRRGRLHEAGARAREAFWESRAIGDRIGAGTALAVWVRCLPAEVGSDVLARELDCIADSDAHTRALIRGAMGWRQLHLGNPDAALAEFAAVERELRRSGIRNHFVAPLRTWQLQALRLATDARPSWSASRRRRDRRAARRCLAAALLSAAVYGAERPATLREWALLSLARGRLHRGRFQLWIATRSARHRNADGDLTACAAVAAEAFGAPRADGTRPRDPAPVDGAAPVAGRPDDPRLTVDRGLVEDRAVPMLPGLAEISRHRAVIAAARRLARLESAEDILAELRDAVASATAALEVQVRAAAVDVGESGPGAVSGAVERVVVPVTMRGPAGHVVIATFPFGEAAAHVQAVEVLAALSGALLDRQALRWRAAAQMVEVQEAERARIARDLHDDLGHLFSGILEGLGALDRRAGSLEPAVTSLRDIARDGIRAVRTVAWSLRPEGLDDLGVIGCVEQLVEDSERMFRIPIDLTVRCADGVLSPLAETALFRIVQEALTNVGRHSGAGEASVLVVRSGDRVRAVVEDNGGGFDPAAARERRSLGLAGMRERARLVGGRVDVVSHIGGGTTVMAEVPVDDDRCGGL
ncbi:AAA family ATPase [Pseudonocardia sp. KRD-184]|uniref:histidine kinase n=1 Tax=Pseudonocardia oceani TaxID=2792013 RepID=A0ABS6U2D0_9PSEU|nr:AAA family ATPase [Pseudonocardia oceani]MBW0088140.1 AAA family ATPase [Pseudonocardia oceani]MBW0095093.1 AAA family ATPase [Pseudonocardia oceani]MBW0107170.1 AAA family ATPase [Pseudonocardia oceani]MBW0119734.1 AAA family ATPase [Pseudonocardia oceani]MBW0126397.1 AAA family ATPase [Pseudonocardia oceani]